MDAFLRLKVGWINNVKLAPCALDTQRGLFVVMLIDYFVKLLYFDVRKVRMASSRIIQRGRRRVNEQQQKKKTFIHDFWCRMSTGIYKINNGNKKKKCRVSALNCHQQCCRLDKVFMKYALRVLWGFDFIIWLAVRWQVVVDAVIFNRRGYTQKKKYINIA